MVYKSTQIEYTKKGFSLIEMLIAVSIILIILAVVLFNHRQFLARNEVTNLAYEVASLLREAQVYGVSVRQQNATVPDFSIPHGVKFFRANNQYGFFADKNKDGNYETSELIKIYTLRGNIKVDTICLGPISSCVNTSAVAVTFTRPDPDAHIEHNDVVYSAAQLTLEDPNTGESKKVVIYSTGHISVE